MKQTSIQIRVSKEQKQEIKTEATKQGRSISNWILWVISQVLKK